MLTEEQKQYVQKHYDKMTAREIEKEIGAKVSDIRTYLHKGYQDGSFQKKRTVKQITEEEKKYIIEHYEKMGCKKISEILNLSKSSVCRIYRKQKGAAGKRWETRKGGITLCTISMCIKEDKNQSLKELARRVAIEKRESEKTCLRKLKRLQKEGRLGYYDNRYQFRKWQCEQ